MFNNKGSVKSSVDVSKSQNRIGHGTIIDGDIVSQGGFRIDGTINGTLKTSAKVVIGKDGKIEGTLDCNNADIEGTFSGILKVQGLLTLKATASIAGEVFTQKLAVEPGAIFNASCKMESATKTNNANKKEKQA